MNALGLNYWKKNNINEAAYIESDRKVRQPHIKRHCWNSSPGCIKHEEQSASLNAADNSNTLNNFGGGGG
jgi:hypothetical protein